MCHTRVIYETILKKKTALWYTRRLFPLSYIETWVYVKNLQKLLERMSWILEELLCVFSLNIDFPMAQILL